jgi:hypothetical protein
MSMPDTIDVVLSVPLRDRDDLTRLARSLNGNASADESRSLDGVTLATALVAITPSSIAVLKAWLVARLEAKKGCVMSFGGVKLQGYSADEVEKIVGVLRRELGDGTEESLNDA